MAIPDADDTLQLLRRDLDMAKLRLQANERQQQELHREHDVLVARIAVLDKRIVELEDGPVPTGEAGLRFVANARAQLPAAAKESG